MRKSLFATAAFLIVGACTTEMADHAAEIHQDHAHTHGDGCGHVKVWHQDHWDYLHDGHLHHVHGDHVDEHRIEVTDINPITEAPLPAEAHADHMHGDGDDAHLMIQHGDHFDYIHDGRLHHVHGDHIDDHGPVKTLENG